MANTFTASIHPHKQNETYCSGKKNGRGGSRGREGRREGGTETERQKAIQIKTTPLCCETPGGATCLLPTQSILVIP